MKQSQKKKKCQIKIYSSSTRDKHFQSDYICKSGFFKSGWSLWLLFRGRYGNSALNDDATPETHKEKTFAVVSLEAYSTTVCCNIKIWGKVFHLLERLLDFNPNFVRSSSMTKNFTAGQEGIRRLLKPSFKFQDSHLNDTISKTASSLSSYYDLLGYSTSSSLISNYQLWKGRKLVSHLSTLASCNEWSLFEENKKITMTTLKFDLLKSLKAHIAESW